MFVCLSHQKINIISYIKKWRKRISIYALESWNFKSSFDISNDSNFKNEYRGELFTDNLLHPFRTFYISVIQFAKTKNIAWLMGFLIPLIISLVLISTPLNSIKVIKKLFR